MKYNDREKKIRIKIVQIDNNELAKCKLGKEFQVKLVTKSRRIIVDLPRISLDERIAKAVTSSIAPLHELVEQLVTDVSELKTDMSSVKVDISNLKTEVANINARLNRNKLKP
jgi:predicted RecB family endonuclease